MSLVKFVDRACAVENLKDRLAWANKLNVHGHFVSRRHSLQTWQKNIRLMVVLTASWMPSKPLAGAKIRLLPAVNVTLVGVALAGSAVSFKRTFFSQPA
jgi:hypothetical protein